MLNNKKLLQNNTIWRICRGAAIAIVVIYIIDIITLAFSYHQQYMNYTQMNVAGVNFEVSTFFINASYSILQITAACLFYAAVLFVASVILKGLSTAEEEKIVLTRGADATLDDEENLEVEIIDLPHTRPQSEKHNEIL